MATSDGDLSATLLGGSDVIYDIQCDPCHTEGQNLEAAGFCQTCGVYLCTGCVRDHKKNPASRLHHLLEAAAMPRTTTRPKINDVLTQPCQKHTDQILEYLCTEDDALCCSACLTLDHTSCRRAYIPDISDGAATSQEYKDVEIDLDRLTFLAQDEEISTTLNEQDNDAYRSKAVDNIKAGRKEMDKILDEAEDRAIKRVDELHSQNAEKLRSAAQSCQSVLSVAKTMAADLGENAKAGKNNQLFVATKMAGRRLPAMEEDINQLKAQKMSRYIFDKDKSVQEFRSAMSAPFPVTVTVREDDVNTTARHVTDVNITAKDDDEDCGINGIAALSGDRLVVTDWNNSAVKLVDLKVNKVTSRLGLSSTILDVIRTKPDQVAVAMGNEKKIEIFTVTDILTRTNTIDVPGVSSVTSLCYYGDRFILLDQQARAVKIVDMTGSIVSTIYTDSDSDPLFKSPRYITLGRTRDVMYVTDWKADTVTCMTLRGRVIWVYKHAELNLPLGVAVGRGGDVMVCSSDTHALQLLSRSGQLVQVLLDKQRGLASGPEAICVFEDKLWVSSASINPDECSFVTLFQLK